MLDHDSSNAVTPQQGVAVKGKDMLWLDTEGAVPVGTTLSFEIKGSFQFPLNLADSVDSVVS